jgi:hypothetical protein
MAKFLPYIVLFFVAANDHAMLRRWSLHGLTTAGHSSTQPQQQVLLTRQRVLAISQWCFANEPRSNCTIVLCTCSLCALGCSRLRVLVYATAFHQCLRSWTWIHSHAVHGFACRSLHLNAYYQQPQIRSSEAAVIYWRVRLRQASCMSFKCSTTAAAYTPAYTAE